MEKSNWVTIAWDENGKPCEGKIEAEGAIIGIYENRLYVQDKKAWNENSGFGRYTIMDISEGQLRYNRFKIVVARGSNDELFFVVEYNGNILTKNGDVKKQLIGISCCIPSGADRVGVIEDVKAEFFYWLKESKEDLWYKINLDLEKIKDFETLNQEEELLARELGILTSGQHVLSEVSKSMKDEYPDGKCPDCFEPIQDDITDGDKCSNCGHIFHHLENTKRMEEMRDEGYMQREQGWKKGMGL